MTKYGLTEVSCVIPNKAAYMDDETWAKVVKLVSPGIRKMRVRNVDFLLCFILYLSNSTSLFLQTLCRLFVTYQSGGTSSRMMASSLTSMSLKAPKNVRRRGSGLGKKRLGQALSINLIINSRQIRTRIKQVSFWS